VATPESLPAATSRQAPDECFIPRVFVSSKERITYIAAQHASLGVEVVDMADVGRVDSHSLHVHEDVPRPRHRWRPVVDKFRFAGRAGEDDGFHGWVRWGRASGSGEVTRSGVRRDRVGGTKRRVTTDAAIVVDGGKSWLLMITSTAGLGQLRMQGRSFAPGL
jgi:hypothetical protein